MIVIILLVILAIFAIVKEIKAPDLYFVVPEKEARTNHTPYNEKK